MPMPSAKIAGELYRAIELCMVDTCNISGTRLNRNGIMSGMMRLLV